jgi:hypothetical protein
MVDLARLQDPVTRVGELVTVSPAEELRYVADGRLADGRSLNPVLSRSLRTYPRVTVVFSEASDVSIEGSSNYDVYSWRLAARHLGLGEQLCDTAGGDAAGSLSDVIKLAARALNVGTALATFAPIEDRTLITRYDSSANGKISEMVFVYGQTSACGTRAGSA